jgi:hypothetical protein
VDRQPSQATDKCHRTMARKTTSRIVQGIAKHFRVEPAVHFLLIRLTLLLGCFPRPLCRLGWFQQELRQDVERRLVFPTEEILCKVDVARLDGSERPKPSDKSAGPDHHINWWKQSAVTDGLSQQDHESHSHAREARPERFKIKIQRDQVLHKKKRQRK